MSGRSTGQEGGKTNAERHVPSACILTIPMAVCQELRMPL